MASSHPPQRRGKRETSSKFRFSRLFPGPFEEHDPKALGDLAERMKRGGDEHNAGTLAGFVYVGQFIDHDLASDQTKLADLLANPRAWSAEGTINYRTPFLDLDSVYGDGPAHDPEGWMYDTTHPGAEVFKLRPAETTTLPDGTELAEVSDADLPRVGGIAVIPEERNDEHLIIGQLHVAFLKFHNRVVEILRTKPEDLGYETVPDALVFAEARRFVTWHYQWLTWNAFLPAVVLADTLCHLKQHGRRLFNPASSQVALPIEFTIAAFRFGHSMVRDAYVLHPRQIVNPATLGEILRPKPAPLRADQVVEWGTFFGGSARVNIAQKIDTAIADGLYDLPAHVVSLYMKAMPRSTLSLPARTLLRGSAVRLPSGQEACAMAEVPVVEINASHPDYAFLEPSGMLRRTPLWYYLLHEAEMRGSNDGSAGGKVLGPLGSLIVAEVIHGVLHADPHSYVHAPEPWSPPVPRFSYLPGEPPEAINSFRNLIAFANYQPA